MSQDAPVLRFHQLHGPDIRIYNSFTTAKRVHPGSGLIFSSHPLKPYQKFALKLSEISEANKEIISVGFTEKHPDGRQELARSLKIVSVKKHSRIKNKVIYFYYTQNGVIHFGIDGQEKGYREGKISTRGPLWAFIHITNPLTTIEVLNWPSFDWSTLSLVPVMLHQSRGRNVKLVKNMICKYDRRLDVSYAFSLNPVKIGEHVIVKILDVDPRSNANLKFGLTGLNPSQVDQKDLPDDPCSLLAKPGYCLVEVDYSWQFKQNDRLSFMISSNGRMKIWRNEATLLKETEVAVNSQLWVFFDIAAFESVEVWTCLPSSSGLEKAEFNDWKEGKSETVISTTSDNSSDEDSTSCVVCCDRAVEAALYPCGHMCMCYGCAKEQWRGAGHGCCPMCRLKIKDVIKIYKI